ncbi:MAG: transporter related protein, partial [Ilumatobacteraceae bacterium]|nr:transporter related protein [Ilumatobacteraceae bacterium]
LPRPGYGRVRWPLLIAAVALTAPVLLRADIGWATVLTLTFVSGIVLTSVVVVTGFAGQLSLCQYSLAGFGAWMTARLIVRHGLPLELALLLGVLCTSAVGALIAMPALRTRGVNLAVVTLGLALMMESIVFNSTLLGGIGGPFQLPTLFGIDIDPLNHPGRYCFTAFIACVLVGLAVANLRRGAGGRRLLAVRSNERAAASLGVGIYSAKVYAFSLAAAIAAVGGVLSAFRTPRPSFGAFGVFGSISVVLYSVLGGIGWASGALLGATLSPGALTTKLLNDYVHALGDVASWLLLVSGILVIVTLNRSPDGMAAWLSRRVGRRLDAAPWRRHPARRQPAELAPIERRRLPPASLAARNVTVRFGGVVALDDASVAIEPGEIVGLIGPNGAGKTTMLDVLSGFTPPTAGSVVMNDRPVDRWSPERRARAGMVRSWQQVELFEEMSVRENLLVAADSKRFGRYLLDLVHPGRRHETATMREVVAELNLAGVLHLHPSSLPHGIVRLVGIARAVTAEPSVLLLDEPAAGLSDVESRELGITIKRIAQRLRIPILITEHDVPLLMAICDRLIVLDFGRVIADGTPDEVSHNPDVVRAYLGEPVDAGS